MLTSPSPSSSFQFAILVIDHRRPSSSPRSRSKPPRRQQRAGGRRSRHSRSHETEIRSSHRGKNWTLESWAWAGRGGGRLSGECRRERKGRRVETRTDAGFSSSVGLLQAIYVLACVLSGSESLRRWVVANESLLGSLKLAVVSLSFRRSFFSLR